MRTLTSIKNGIFFILTVALLVACNNNGQEKYTPQNHVVKIKDMQFQPDTLIVNIGDTVTWINQDIVAHNVTQKDSTWASPLMLPLDTWQKIINNSDSYYCSIHINMKGEIVVENK